jgi:hypothetical protein
MQLGRILRPLLLLAGMTCPLLGGEPTGYYSVASTDFLERSDRIFAGRLVDKQSFWKAGNIFTRYMFDVTHTIKGRSTEHHELIEYGGTVDGVTMSVTHQASYAVGGEYLVISYVDLLGHNRTFSGPLGQFPILSNGSGMKVVRVFGDHPLRKRLVEESGTFVRLDDLSLAIRQELVRGSYE